jgi:hypothetical protein
VSIAIISSLPIITGGAAITAIILPSRIKGPKSFSSSVRKFIAAIPAITPELNLELATATQTGVLTKTDSMHVQLVGLADLPHHQIGLAWMHQKRPMTGLFNLRCSNTSSAWLLPPQFDGPDIDANWCIAPAFVFNPLLNGASSLVHLQGS